MHVEQAVLADRDQGVHHRHHPGLPVRASFRHRAGTVRAGMQRLPVQSAPGFVPAVFFGPKPQAALKEIIHSAAARVFQGWILLASGPATAEIAEIAHPQPDVAHIVIPGCVQPLHAVRALLTQTCQTAKSQQQGQDEHQSGCAWAHHSPHGQCLVHI
jgi:hypothetical protein